MFERRHYREIADMIRDAKTITNNEEMALFFCMKFSQRNSKFKPSVFLKACGMEHLWFDGYTEE